MRETFSNYNISLERGRIIKSEKKQSKQLGINFIGWNGNIISLSLISFLSNTFEEPFDKHS